jgi:hypothetical protein
VTFKPDEILVLHIATVSGTLSKVVMVLRVEGDTVWLTDGFTEIPHVIGDSTYGYLTPLSSGVEQQRRYLKSLLERKDRKRIAEILDPYDELALECDGFTRVATYALTQAGIGHRIFAGECRVKTKLVEPHMWIQCGEWTVDYRLGMWAGKDAPHGVFRVSDYPGVKYGGHEIRLSVSKVIFDVLTGPSPVEER